jgi:hypothetical protein
MDTNNINKMQSIDPRYYYYSPEEEACLAQSIPSDPTLTSVNPPFHPENITAFSFDPAALDVDAAKDKLLAYFKSAGRPESERAELKAAALDAYREIFDALAGWGNYALTNTILKELKDFGLQLLTLYGKEAKVLLTELFEQIAACLSMSIAPPTLPPAPEKKSVSSPKSETLEPPPAEEEKQIVKEEKLPPPPPPASQDDYSDYGYSPTESWRDYTPAKGTRSSEEGASSPGAALERETLALLNMQNILNELSLKVSRMVDRWVLEDLYRKIIEAGR